MNEPTAFIYLLEDRKTHDYYIGGSVDPESARTHKIRYYNLDEENVDLLEFRGTIRALTQEGLDIRKFDVRRRIHEMAKGMSTTKGLRGFWFHFDTSQLQTIQNEIAKLCNQYNQQLPRNDDADEFEVLINHLDDLAINDEGRPQPG